MTDDFQLFQDQASGDDADIALITAYLARELSVVQIVAVEERLATDRAFREKVAPIMEAWALPTKRARGVGATSLTQDEIEAGWQRYLAGHSEPAAPGAPRLVRTNSATPTRRKVSMTRIAASIAAVVLPIVTLAQVAVYAAKHKDVPGHAVARTIVAPFVDETPVTPPPETQVKPLPSPEDTPIGKQLEKAPEVVQRARETAAIVEVPTPAASSGSPATSPAPVRQSPNPDRAKIAALATQHHAAVVRGDTAAEYIVMVLDASGKYVWSTFGSGGVSITVAGDKRTPAERMQFTRDNRTEYTGMAPGGTARGGGGFGGGGGAVSAGAVPRSGGGGAGGGRGGRVPDSLMGTLLRRDSLVSSDTSMRRTVSPARLAIDSISQLVARIQVVDSVGGYARATAVGRGTGGGGGGAGGAILFAGADTTAGQYSVRAGRVNYSEPSTLNTASGLQQPGGAESGVQGLSAASIASGETYTFAPGQLSPQLLRIIVLNLATGATWKGR